MNMRVILAACCIAIILLAAVAWRADAAQAYLHLANCQDGLRTGGANYGGDYAHDDDVHAGGVRLHATAWGGWTSYARFSDADIHVWAAMLVGGVWRNYEFYCYGSDGGFNDDPWGF